MEVTVSVPDTFVPLANEADLSREMLEVYAIEKYRQGEISVGRLAEILDLYIGDAHALIKKYKVPSSYGIEDMERDRRAIEKLFSK